LAGWDDDILAIELQHLTEVVVDFDVTVTGFEMPVIDLIIEKAKAPKPKDGRGSADRPHGRSCNPPRRSLARRAAPHSLRRRLEDGELRDAHGRGTR
jgi:hypothetical protein